jgi:hypothetical protein
MSFGRSAGRDRGCVDVCLEMWAAVPAEDELVGVDVDVLVADTVIRPVAPPLEIGEEEVHPRQDLMRRRCIDGAQVDRLVTTIFQPPVGGVAVGEEQAADGGVVPDEGVQALAVDVDDTLQPTTRRVLSRLHLHRSNHENLADGAAALTAPVWFVFAAERHVGLVDLDDATKWTPVGIDHCPPQLVKQKPGGLVAAEAQLRLELQGGHPVRMGGEKVGCQEPDAEREMRAMHHRSGDERCLVAAARGGSRPVVIDEKALAFPYPWASLQPPGAVPSATRAWEAALPTLLPQIFRAGVVIGEVRGELLQRWRFVVGPACRPAVTRWRRNQAPYHGE